MEMRFGLKNDGNEKTQKEVADELRNITKLYIKIREKNNKKNEKRNTKQNRIIVPFVPFVPEIFGNFAKNLRYEWHGTSDNFCA